MHRAQFYKILIGSLTFFYLTNSQATAVDLHVEQILDQTAVLDIVNTVTAKLRKEIANDLYQQPVRLAESELLKIDRVLIESYSTPSIRAKFLNKSSARLKEEHKQAIMDFFSTPLGRQIARGEKWVNSRELSGYQEYRSAASVIGMLSAERRRVIEELAGLVFWGELVHQLFLTSNAAKLQVYRALLPQKRDILDSDLRAQLKGVAQNPSEYASAIITERSFAAYSMIITENLAQYAIALSSPNMRSAASILAKIWTEVLEEATMELEGRFEKEFAARIPSAVQDGFSATFAYKRENAVEVCLPEGARDYINNLVCPAGETPDTKLLGNAGPRSYFTEEYSDNLGDRLLDRMTAVGEVPLGEPDIHIVDAYSIKCGRTEHIIFIDRYHCQAPKLVRAPKDFSLRR